MNFLHDPRPNTDEALPRLPGGSKVLVTGATGFIGGRLAERLIEQSDVQVCCIVRDIARTPRLHPPIKIIKANLNDATEIKSALQGVNYVFHCAYDWHSSRQNINGLRNLVEGCITHSVNRLVHISTFSVYESLQDGLITEEVRAGDRANKYVCTKLDLEKIIFDAVRTQGLAATIVQPTIVYGPFCDPFTNAPAEKLIFGDVVLREGDMGLCNAVYVDDIVDGLMLAATSPAAVGDRFIMSGPEPVTWATFYTEMAKVLGTKPPLFWSHERIEQLYRDNRQGRLVNVAAMATRISNAIMRRNAVRKFSETILGALPVRLRAAAPGPSAGNRALGKVHLPESWYSLKGKAGSEKARSKLGYSPRFDIRRGMEVTGCYLRSVYGESVPPGRDLM